MNRYFKWSIVFLALLIIVPVSVGLFDMVGAAYSFNKEVHSHMENAYYANSPSLMKSELQKAISGMNELQLEDEMYSAFWYWEHTPDRKMDYQYKHLDGVIERIDAVITWYNINYGENATGGTESLGDVFEQKMDNLRGFLIEGGWSDWIAKGTFYSNHHIFLYFWNGLILWVWISLMVILLVGCVIIGGSKDNWW